MVLEFEPIPHFTLSEQHNTPILQNTDPIIQVAVFMMVVLQIILHNSRRGCHFILSMLQYMVQLCLLRNGRILNVYDRKLLADFPKDPGAVVKQFKELFTLPHVFLEESQSSW